MANSSSMIATGAQYHWVKSISASTYGDGALKLTLHGDKEEDFQRFNETEIMIFTDDEILVDRLIAAINGVAGTKQAEDV